MIVFFFALILIGCCGYYFTLRYVDFELVKVIDRPQPNFDRSGEDNYDYVHNQENLWLWLKEWYLRDNSHVEKGIIGYDSSFVEGLATNLDFDQFDYIITYQKELKKLKHSPYLSHEDAAYYFDKRTPLIPIFKEKHTTKVYIYRINKNTNFRSVGP